LDLCDLAPRFVFTARRRCRLFARRVLASGNSQFCELSQEAFWLTVAQLVQTAFDPFLGLVLSIKRPAQFPQVFAGVVKV
jgi:hypothetical protein